MATYEKVRVIVFTHSKDIEMYFKLFKMLLGDKATGGRYTRYDAHIEGEKFLISFLPASHAQRGHRAHYVLNLTQDKEFDAMVAQPIQGIRYYLEHDPKWSELF